MSDKLSFKVISNNKVPLNVFFNIILPRLQDSKIIVALTSPAQEKNRSPQSSMSGILLRNYLKQEEINARNNPNHGKGALLRKQGRKKMAEFKKNDSPVNCEYCSVELNAVSSNEKSLRSKNKTLDHFIPLSRGGVNDISNFKYCCARCNLYKADIHPLEEKELWLKFCKWVKFRSRNPESKFSVKTHRRNIALKNQSKELEFA